MRKFSRELLITFPVWLVINIILILVVFSNHTENIDRPALNVTKMPKESTALITPIDNATHGNSESEFGNIPGLQISYSSEEEMLKVISYYKMKPLIIDLKNTPLYLIDFDGRTLKKVNNPTIFANFSPRIRRLQSEIFTPFLEKAAECAKIDMNELSVILLVPKEVENLFVQTQIEFLRTTGLSPDEILVLRGYYAYSGTGYKLIISEAVCKDGTVKSIKG